MQMSQTPLHVAAGYNNTGIVKFLLDFQGTDKVELEAKNMVIEVSGICCSLIGTSATLIVCSELKI
jgi:ankyrin repeat protein